MKPVALTSKATKACDVSRTTIYRANSPTIYARVNELEFHCIYCQVYPLVEFPLYIQPCNNMQQMQEHERQMLKYKTQSTKPNSLKPSKTSPPLASIAKMGKKN